MSALNGKVVQLVASNRTTGIEKLYALDSEGNIYQLGADGQWYAHSNPISQINYRIDKDLKEAGFNTDEVA